MSSPDANLILLAELRERAGLTQADMARLCGLRGRQSHQTAGAWERGEITPSARRRVRFMGYLWDHLGLRRDPAEFDAVWEILVHAWDWEPLGDDEWSQLTNEPRPVRAAPSTPPPFQAPARSPHFVGRTRELDELQSRLSVADGSRTVALVGMGGVGKSTLAIQAAHTLRDHFADGVLWANVATADPLDILQTWALAHGCDFSAISELEARAAAVRNLLAQRRTLIVLDDVRAPERVRPLLPGGEMCAVLMTTRDRDAAMVLDAHPLPLDELTPDATLHLLRRIVGPERIDAEPEMARAICDRLHHLPLAIEISAKRLARAPRLTLALMEQQLRDASARLNRLALKDLSVRASLEISWAALDAELQQTFACIGVLNGRSFTGTALAHIAQLDGWQMEDHPVSLAALSLLRPDADERYQQHPLVADFAREQLGDATATQTRLIDYFLHYAQTHQTEYARLEPEWENMVAAMETAHGLQEWASVLAYADALSEPWFTRARYAQARRAYPWACDAAEALGDTQALARQLCRWGRACFEQNAYEEAELRFQRARGQCGDDTDRALRAEIHYWLGRMALERAQYDVAEQYLGTSERLYLQVNDLDGLALIFYQHAQLCYDRGQLHEAETYCKNALARQESSGNQTDAIATLRLLADIAIERDDFAEAASHCERARVVSEETHNLAELAATYYSLAVVDRLQANLSGAREHLRRALPLFEQLGMKAFTALARYEQSRIHALGGNRAAAKRLGRQSITLFRETQQIFNLVYALNHLGTVCCEDGDEQQGQACWQEALEIAEQQSHPLAAEIRQQLRAYSAQPKTVEA